MSFNIARWITDVLLPRDVTPSTSGEDKQGMQIKDSAGRLAERRWKKAVEDNQRAQVVLDQLVHRMQRQGDSG